MSDDYDCDNTHIFDQQFVPDSGGYRPFGTSTPSAAPAPVKVAPANNSAPQIVQSGGHSGGPARQLPFFRRHFNKLVGALIVGVPLFYMAHVHLDYSSEAHRPKDDNPVSYLAYGLKHADHDVTRAAQAAGTVSDQIMANLENRPVPTSAENSQPTAPVRTIGTQYPINLCVPADLVDNQSWDNPAPGSKMDAFRGALRAFILASGDPRVQYRVREGAFESFNSASNPASLVYGVNAAAACPANDYRYTIPVVR